MLRVANDVSLVRMPWSLGGVFYGHYAVANGKKVYDARWKKSKFEELRASQKDCPIALVRNGKRMLWHFHDRYYWAEDNLDADDVKALVLKRERRDHQELTTARSLMRSGEAGKPVRVPIPRELRRVVFERDGGKCVECGSSFDLQYDHILPVALGGATTIENLQLLCADCNRFKSDSL